MFRRPPLRFHSLADLRKARSTPGEVARELDEKMFRFARAHNLLRRVIGRGLAQLADRNQFMQLGYSTLGSYVDQELGIGARHAQELAYVERGLRERPAMRAAYDEGAITFSAMRLLVRQVPVVVEQAWAELARGMTVHEVRAALEAFHALLAEAAPTSGGTQSADNQHSDHQSTENQPDDDDSTVTSKAGYPLHAPEDDDEEPSTRWIRFEATPALAARWFTGLELARRQESSDLPVPTCVEMWILEFMSGEGADALRIAIDEALQATAAIPSDDGSKEDPDAPHPEDVLPWRVNLAELRAYWRDIERDAGQLTDHWSFLPWGVPTVALPSALEPRPEDDARAVHRRLREAVRLVGRVDANLRRLFADFAHCHLYEDLEFVSPEHYARERLGMGASTARALLSLQRRLRGYEQLTGALDRGEISATQAQQIVRIVHSESELLWIEHAKQTTVRFLRDDVEGALRLRATDVETYNQTHGLPQHARTATDSSRTRKRTGELAREHWETLSNLARARAEALAGGGSKPPAPGDPAADADRQTCAQKGTANRADQTAGSAAAADRQTCAQGGTSNRADETAGCAAATDRQACAQTSTARPAPLPVQTFREALQCILEEQRGEADHYATDRRVVSIRFRLPAELSALWDDACQAARVLHGGLACTADCVELILDAYLATWGEEALEMLRLHPILARDDWKCAVPTCGRRAMLHVHHLLSRAQGGGNEHWNQATLCRAHHLQGVHEGRIRVTGRAPDALIWELGLHGDGDAHLVVVDRRIMTPGAHSQGTSPATPLGAVAMRSSH